MGYFNVQSLRKKCIEVVTLLKDLKVDIACISETWFIGDDAAIITEIRELSYRTYHVPCESHGGDAGMLYSPKLKLNRHKNKTKFISFEFIETILQLNKARKLLVTCIYRSCSDGLTTSFSNLIHISYL